LLEAATKDDESLLKLQRDPTNLAPERVIVFDVAGNIGDFTKALARIPGFEFISESDTEAQSDENFAVKDARKGQEGEIRSDKMVAGRLYLALPDIGALQELVSLWERWSKGQAMDPGFAPFGHLFAQLRTLRPWGPLDRVPEDTIEYWRAELERAPDRPVRTEVELWYRRSSARRRIASQTVRLSVSSVGGTVLDEATIEEIAYHGFLIEIPAQEVRSLAERHEVALALADDVMFLRPQSSLSSPIELDELADTVGDSRSGPPAGGSPVVALLDGVPLQKHVLLDGRLSLDDPDNLQARAPARQRMHGTAMASLIIHGDLNALEAPVDRPLYVRPLLIPDQYGHERTEGNRLLVDTIYTAVLRMKGTPDKEGTAPSVFLVNFSLGDSQRPFAGLMSPLARLLDFLSATFGILFLVSAGNVTEPLEIEGFRTWDEFQSVDVTTRERAVLAALDTAKHKRTLLSPAESLNALTVGAHHSDQLSSRSSSPNAVDPYEDELLPNPSSALGLGYRRMLKPELYMPGGREHLRLMGTSPALTVRFGSPQRMYGLAAAAPDPQDQGRLNQITLSDGTSSATALATHACHRIFAALMDQEGGSAFTAMPPEYYAVAVKALLVHRATWNGKAEAIMDLCGPAGAQRHYERRENASRFMGFGIPKIDEVLECAENRATLLGYGALEPGHGHGFHVPLPGALSGITDPRALTITLAWISPTRPGFQSYRGVKLETGPLEPKMAMGVERVKHQPAEKAAGKGTVFHERFEGSRAVAFVGNGELGLQVWCREDAGGSIGPTRYAIAVTIETETAISVYDDIQQRLRVAPIEPSAA
jgi:hypothetical protein